MDSPSSRKNLRIFRYVSRPVACKCLLLLSIALFYRALLLYCSSGNGLNRSCNDGGSSIRTRYMSDSDVGIHRNKFLEVPQIAWGLNNQKIAFARACLTARMLNRSLLMPSLSASLFYKELDKLNPISFDKVFRFDRFNSLCSGFVQIARFSDPRNGTNVFDLMKGSGRRWTAGRDLEQLREASEKPIDDFEVIRIVGKNPFLWHDHWPIKDYAKVFECMEAVDEIRREADKVVTKIRQAGEKAMAKLKPGFVPKFSGNPPTIPYVAVHMRIEIDWMIHCKKLEQRKNVSEICSSKEQIMERVGNVVGSKIPVVVYLAVADSLLEDSSILTGWRDGLLPYEKKSLGVEKMYKKYPYLIQSAIDYEVCSRADVFSGVETTKSESSRRLLDRIKQLASVAEPPEKRLQEEERSRRPSTTSKRLDSVRLAAFESDAPAPARRCMYLVAIRVSVCKAENSAALNPTDRQICETATLVSANENSATDGVDSSAASNCRSCSFDFRRRFMAAETYLEKKP